MVISLSDIKELRDSKMYLANGNKEIINIINKASNRNLVLNLNQYSELSFEIKKQNNINVFNEITVNQKIYFEKLGWFILNIPTYSHDEDNIEMVSCKAYSAEYELSQKHLNNFYINSGEYGSIDAVCIYNPEDTSHSLLNLVIEEKFPNWNIGHVDESLKSKQRTFSIESINVYSFLTEELAKTLQCIFIFDIENYTINVYDIAHFGIHTDVYLSHNTVVKNLTKSPISDDGITNCIRVRGADDLDIRAVNCGFEYIYDLSYFYSNMSNDLYTAWINYLSILETNTNTFKEKQFQYNTIQYNMDAIKNRQPDSAESTDYNEYGIDELNVLLKSVKQSIINYEENGYNVTSSPFYQAYLEYVNKKTEIENVLDSLNTQYSDYQTQLDEVYNEIISIKQTVSLANNFTAEQYVELSSYIKEGDYTDNTFAITSSYTEAQIIQKQYDLKVSATTALSSLSQPQYQIETDIVNIGKIKAFESNYSKFALGNFMVIYINASYTLDERLTSIEINLDDDSDFKITFSNSTRSVNGMSDLDYLIDNTTGISSSSFSNSFNGSGTSSFSSLNGSDYVTKSELSLALMNMSIDNGSTFSETQINILENIINGEFTTIDADYIYSKLIEASQAQFDVLASHIITSDWIESNKAIFNEILSNYIATTVFNAEVGNIKTILAGNVGTDSLQTITLSAANTTLDQTFVNILLANYITAKTIFGEKISTNEFEIGSDDNTLTISDGTMTIKDNNNKTRIQIGKDSNGNFCFLLLDSNGSGTIIDQNGVTEHAIADGLIKSDKLANKTKNYSGIGSDKLDIDSVVTGINDSTTTIKSTKIYFDESNQTLNEIFAEMNTAVNGLDETLDSYGLQIEENSNGINTLITNTTITKEDGTVVQLKDAYNKTLDTVDKHTQTISSMQSDIDKNIGDISTLQSNITMYTQDFNGFKLEVSKTYTTKDELDNLEIGGRNLLRNTKDMVYGAYVQWTSGAIEKNIDIDGYSVATIKATGEWNALNFYFTGFDIEYLEGKHVVISALVKSNGLASFPQNFQMNASVFNNAGNRIKYTGLGKFDDARYNHDEFIDNEWVRLIWTGTLPFVRDMLTASSNDYTKYGIQFYVNSNNAQYPLQIKQVKCEFGNKATDWTPAPEDIEKKITTVQSAITENADKISLVVEGTDSSGNVILTDNALNVIADNIDLSGKVTFNSLDSSTQNKVNSALETANNANNKVDNFEIGGTNILRNCNHYTETNKLNITATKDNHYEITNAKVTLEKGKKYTFSCQTDSIWGTGIDDTVEAYLLLDGKYDTYFRLDMDNGFTFTAPENGEYWLRVDVNKNGSTHNFWNFKIEKGNKATDYSPNPDDVTAEIEYTKNIASSANAWTSVNGNNMTALRSMVLKWTKNAVSNTTTIDGGWITTNTITSKQIAANTITSNEIAANTITAEKLNIDDLYAIGATIGGFTITNTALYSEYSVGVTTSGDVFKGAGISSNKYDTTSIWAGTSYINRDNAPFRVTNTGDIIATSGNIGSWRITPNGGLVSEMQTGTAPGTLNRLYLQPFSKEYYEETWVISSQYFSIDSTGKVSDNGYAYWKILGNGEAYFYNNLYADNIECTTFLGNWQTWNNGGLFTKKMFGSSTAGSRYCFWIEPIRDEQGLDTQVFYCGYQNSNTTTPDSWSTLCSIGITGDARFDNVWASKYNTVSDKNKKHDICELDEQSCIDIICSLNPVKFKYNDTQYERNHWGFIAQDVEETLNSLGVSWQDYAVVDKSVHKEEVFVNVTDANNNPILGEDGKPKQEPRTIETNKYDYYLRYEAFIAPLVKTVQAQQKKLDMLQKEINDLKNK